MKLQKRLLLCVTMAGLSLANISCGNAGKTEIARLEYHSSGCFHGSHYQIRITKTNDSISAELSSTSSTDKRKLTQAQLDSFNVFAKELTELEEKDGCTTVDSYILTIDHKRIKKTDGSCSWMGFDKLKKTLFD